MEVGFRVVEKSDNRDVDMPVLVWVRRFSFSFSSNTDAMSQCQSRETILRCPRESQLAVVERGMRRC